MTDPIRLIPLAEINPEVVTRDRIALDPDAMTELKDSITRGGLRQPIEVFEFEEPHYGCLYGLISGFRRLRAFRDLHATEPERFAAIPAFVRKPSGYPDIIAAMVEENDIRADLSPWERGAVVVSAVRAEHFPDFDAAIRALYPSANRHKRARIRAICDLVDEMEGLLKQPEKLTQQDLLRYAAATAAGFGDLMERAVRDSIALTHEAQWEILNTIIRESETHPEEHPIVAGRPNTKRVRRLYTATRRRITMRRERTKYGFTLHVSGRDANTQLINAIFDEFERQFIPE